MRSCCSFDQLRSNAYPTARPAYGAFQEIAHTQFAPNLLHVNRTTLVGETRISGDHEEPANAGQRRDNVLDHAISEIFLLGIAAHVLERQHRDRGLVGQRQRQVCRSARRWLGTSGLFGKPDSMNTNWPGDVLDLLLPHVLEREGELVAYLVAHYPADADPARLGQGF